MNRVKVGLIGYGYWGPNLARNFHELPNSELTAIADQKEEQLNRVRAKYPQVIQTRDYKEFFKMGVEVAVISTPPKTHYQIAKDCLLNNLHVLVEKPLTLQSEHAQELIEIAASKDRILMVGHTFEYNTAVQHMKKYIDNHDLGDLYYLDTARLNLGLFQRDTNVLWDLAPHDISILLYLVGKNPIAVSAQGKPCVIPGVYDVAYLSLEFPNNLMAYVHVSWLDPHKVRRVTVVGSKKMAVYNDVEADGKIKIYDKGVDAPSYTNGFGEFQYNYRSGDIVIPKIHFSEPLLQECQHFIDSIINNKTPNTPGESGLRVIKIIEAAERSMNKNSTQEEISW